MYHLLLLHAYFFVIKTLLYDIQDLAVMESMQSALENVVSAVFDGTNEVGGSTSEVHIALCRIFEGFLVIYISLTFRSYLL